MPVNLEKVSHPTAQDLIDLEKIYADYPTDLNWTALNIQLEENANLNLYALRFNDRYLGAFTALQQADSIEIKHLCVRIVTRQRHVGRDLLRLFKAIEPQQNLVFNHCLTEDPAISRLFAQAGFKQQNQQFIYQP